MLSPAQRHNAKIKARQALEKCQVLDAEHSLHVQLAALESDVKRLRNLDTLRDRTIMKRNELLPRWLPTAQAYLDSGEVYQNPILSHCVVWLFDVEELDQAVDWADVAIAQGQETPGNFRSKFPAFVADTMLAWAEMAASCGDGVEPYFSRTFTNVTQNWRLHEEITAKWFKFAGLLMLRDDEGKPRASALDDVEQLEKAGLMLAQAEGLYKNVGVGTMRKQISARIRALQKS